MKFISIMVEDQEKALNFYTNIPGFNKMADNPMGEYRWLTITSPDGIEGVELALEPLWFPPAKVYRKELFNAGIPATALITNDINPDYTQLKIPGVVFRSEPVNTGVITAA